MQKRIKIISVILVVVILAVGAYMFYKSNKSYQSNESNGSNKTNQPNAANETSQAPKPQGPLVYTHPEFGFTISAPDGFTAGSFPEGENGNITLIQNSANKYGMQIFVRPFEEESVLTVARIREEIPDMKIENPIEVKVGEVPAVAFYTLSDSGQRTREIWFTQNKNLFQISANAEYDNITGSIMENWKWE